MHDPWEDMIPFYIAGTLEKPDSVRLENHLGRCPECRKSLAEWREIADIVRADAARQMRALPPLSHQVLHAAQSSGRRFVPSVTLYQQPQPPARRYPSASITLVAAVFTVILFGGLVALMVLRGTQNTSSTDIAQQPSGIPLQTNTPVGEIIVVEPSITLTVPPKVTPSPTLLLPTRVPSTRFPPTPMPQGSVPPTEILGAGGVQIGLQPLLNSTCILHAAVESVDLYAGPAETYPIVNTFSSTDELTALAQSDNGWYQADYTVGASHWTGWARQELVYFSGDCTTLPVIAAADYQSGSTGSDGLPPEGTPTEAIPMLTITYTFRHPPQRPRQKLSR